MVQVDYPRHVCGGKANFVRSIFLLTKLNAHALHLTFVTYRLRTVDHRPKLS